MSPEAPQLRLFFAVPLIEGLRERVLELQREMGRWCRDVRVKWVEPENLHLTLKFVGDAPAARLGEFVAAAEQVARDATPCKLDYHGVGCFASRGRPRTIWLGLRRELPELGALATALDAALARAGLAEPERRPFHGHLTLGRVRDGGGGANLLAHIRRLADAPVGVQPLDSFALISSDLTSRGPIYTERAWFGLGG